MNEEMRFTGIMMYGIGVICGYIITYLFHRSMLVAILRDLGFTTSAEVRTLTKRMEQALEEADPVAHAKLIRDIAASEGKEVVEVRLEKVEDSFYAYRIDNEEFLGQGRSKEELINALTMRMPGTVLEFPDSEALLEMLEEGMLVGPECVPVKKKRIRKKKEVSNG